MGVALADAGYSSDDNFTKPPAGDVELLVAEIEIGIFSRQCLSQHIPAKTKMQSEALAWERQRNDAEATVD